MQLSEKADFDVDIWMGLTIPNRTYSLIEAFRFDEAQWRSVLHDLSALASTYWPNIDRNEELLGLPLESELQRRLAKRQAEDARRELEEKAKREVEAKDRVTELQERIANELGQEHQAWIGEPLKDLAGLSPAQAAAIGGSDFTKAKQELASFGHRLREIAYRRAEQDKQTAMLRKQIQDRCGKSELTDNWMRGTNPKLGMHRPNDICTSESSRLECFRIFETDYKKFRR